MGHYAALQVYRPGGIANASGSPNFLRDLSSVCYQAQWTDLIQGGLDKAVFDCTMPYESIQDINAGNWVVWAILGAEISANAHVGDTSLTVQQLQNVQIPTLYTQTGLGLNGETLIKQSPNLDLKEGDLLLVTDGINAELFTAGRISGDGPTWTVALASAWSNIQIASLATLASDVPQNASQITIKYVTQTGQPKLANGDVFAIGNDGYTVQSVSGPTNGIYTITLTSNATQSYSKDTPISRAGIGATAIYVNTPTTPGWEGSGNAGLPSSGNIWLDSGAHNAEENSISSLSGTTKVVLGTALQNAHGAGAPVIFKMSNALQNAYSVGSAIVVKVRYQGYILNRVRSTTKEEPFSVSCQGFFNRYNSLIDSSTVQGEQSSTQLRLDIASYGATLPMIIVNDSIAGTWLAEDTGIKVNIDATDETFVELIDTILRQENGGSPNIQYAVWVAEDRQVRHLPIATVDLSQFVKYQIGGKGPTYVTPTYYLSLADQSFGLGEDVTVYGDTIGYVQTTDMDMTNLMNAAVVTGTTAPDGSSIYNQNTTTLAQNYTEGQTTLQVTSIPSTWPNGGSGLWVLVNRGQSDDENRTFVSYSGNNVEVGSAFAEDLDIGDKVELVTKLQASYSPGAQKFTVGNAYIFSSGQEMTLTPTGTSETLTIDSIDYSSGVITTTTACKKSHSNGDIACLAANGSGLGPRILIENAESIEFFGWLEGTLSSQDIFDEPDLVKWANNQLKVLAWPVTNAEVNLTTTQARISGRDLVWIGPFLDGTALVANVNSVQYNATAADQNIAATLELGVLRSTAAGVMRQIVKQRNDRHRYHLPDQKGK